MVLIMDEKGKEFYCRWLVAIANAVNEDREFTKKIISIKFMQPVQS
jgi:hypothetical protein